PSPQVTYDMSVTPDGGVRLASMGVGPVAGARAPALAPSPAPRWRTPLIAGGIVLGGLALAAVICLAGQRLRRRGV
ncbi:MAG TPA: hypothetical protein VGP96_12615, partial [Candidatus Dormibacteraeota bacterium]|nr:hypothetical protein [Candidatus Dormibacteraeota bacterium]